MPLANVNRNGRNEVRCLYCNSRFITKGRIVDKGDCWVTMRYLCTSCGNEFNSREFRIKTWQELHDEQEKMINENVEREFNELFGGVREEVIRHIEGGNIQWT